jgi:hypothetical protein
MAATVGFAGVAALANPATANPATARPAIMVAARYEVFIVCSQKSFSYGLS